MSEEPPPPIDHNLTASGWTVERSHGKDKARTCNLHWLRRGPNLIGLSITIHNAAMLDSVPRSIILPLFRRWSIYDLIGKAVSNAQIQKTIPNLPSMTEIDNLPRISAVSYVPISFGRLDLIRARPQTTVKSGSMPFMVWILQFGRTPIPRERAANLSHSNQVRRRSTALCLRSRTA